MGGGGEFACDLKCHITTLLRRTKVYNIRLYHMCTFINVRFSLFLYESYDGVKRTATGNNLIFICRITILNDSRRERFPRIKKICIIENVLHGFFKNIFTSGRHITLMSLNLFQKKNIY